LVGINWVLVDSSGILVGFGRVLLGFWWIHVASGGSGLVGSGGTGVILWVLWVLVLSSGGFLWILVVLGAAGFWWVLVGSWLHYLVSIFAVGFGTRL
jgi:hypothetical protein